MTQIRWTRPLHAELCYHVLSHLDLGCDAASIYNPKLRRQPWVAPLLEAYHAAPGRLVAQVLPLITPTTAGLIARLRAQEVRGFDDPEGQVLCRRLADALDIELPQVRERWHDTAPAARMRGEALMAWIVPELRRLRGALYADAETEPALKMVDCEALAYAGGTHGRATAGADEHLVAVSFAAPKEQVLCQVLHEELHCKIDPTIRAAHSVVSQDTLHSSRGYQLHRRLEQAAVEAGQQLVEREAPELLPAYAAWRRRHSV